MRNIIIDGYNVIRAEPRFQSLERVSLEHARDVLVQTLASAPRLSNERIVVVFDGRFGSRSHVHASRRGRVEILYSGIGQTADEVIIDQVRRLLPARTVVVSNDLEVRDRARVMGSDVSSAENLLKQVPGPVLKRRTDEDDAEERATLSTVKRGNPRRSSRKSRRREVRF